MSIFREIPATSHEGKVLGRVNEITTVSLIKRGRVELLRLLLDHSNDLMIKALGKVETIHYAAWFILPMNGRDYLIFISNYTGTFEKYIDDFGSVLTLAIGLDVIWSHCEEWPGIDSVDTLKDFIRATTTQAELYYSAHPNATVRDVRKGLQAVNVVQEFFDLN